MDARDIEKISDDTPQKKSILSENTKLKIKKYANGGVKLTLCVVGAGAGALYFGPAETCADSPSCGQFLSDGITRPGSIAVYTAGGLDYSVINAYFSAKSVQVFIDYLKKQKSFRAKVLKGGIVIVYSLAQNIPTFLASESTSTAPWQMFLTVSGAVPGTFYGTVMWMDRDVPIMLSHLGRILTRIRNTFVDLCIPISEAEWQFRARMAHYIREQNVFNSQINAKMRYIIANARNLDVGSGSNTLDFIFKQDALPDSYISMIARHLGNLVGFGFASNFTAAFLTNTWQFFNQYVPGLPLQIGITLALSFANIYGNLKLTMHGVSSFFEAIVDVCRGKPINSLLFQLRPGVTSLALMLGLGLSVFSYAVANTLYEKDFPEDSIAREVFRYGADAGINIYHYAGVVHTVKLFFSLLTPNEKDQFLFRIENEIEQIKRWSLQDFAEFVEKNSVLENSLYGLHPYANAIDDMGASVINPDSNLRVDEESPLIQGKTVEDEIESVTDTSAAKPSYFSSFCSFFWCPKKPKAEPILKRSPSFQAS